MTDKAVTTGTFSEVRFVKTRSVMVIHIEVPIEAADMALQALGGVPQPGKEVAVAVARLNPNRTLAGGPDALEPKRESLAYQAGALCENPVFIAYLNEEYGWPQDMDAAEKVRKLCGVESRSQLDTELVAASKWRELRGRFDAWKQL